MTRTTRRNVGRKKVAMLALASMLALSACQTTGAQKETGGTLLGAGMGALVGSQIGSGRGTLVAVAIGALGGAMMGRSVGRSLDRADRIAMDRAQAVAADAPIGRTVAWRNPDSGAYGEITPVREGWRKDSGAYCREYQQSVTIGGETEKAFGQACRQPDGSWKIS